jgi:hypothetical protein
LKVAVLQHDDDEFHIVIQFILIQVVNYGISDCNLSMIQCFSLPKTSYKTCSRQMT